MKNEDKRKMLLFLAFVSCVVGVFALKRRYGKNKLKFEKIESKNYKKNALKLRKLVSKETEILNVFTGDYVMSAYPYAVAKDEKNHNISSVYTNKAKQISKKNKLYDNKKMSSTDVEKEYLQVKDFIIKLNKFLPNATMVIHVVSDDQVEKYKKIIKDLSLKIDLGIEIKINSEILETIFEE